MEKVYRDFSGMKVSQVKTAVREMLMADFAEFLTQKYTKCGAVGAAEMGVVVGFFVDEDGFEHEVSAIVKATAKPFYDSVGTKGRVTEQYVLEDEVEAYEMERKAASAKRKGRPKKGEEE